MDIDIFRELLAEIDRIPVVDIHTHIQADAPTASSLADITLYQYIAAELETSGVDPVLLQSENARKRAIETAQFMPRIANTSMYWCLTQILTDLYESGAPHESDMESLWSKVETTAADAGWADKVLGQANVSKIFVTCDWQRRIPRISGAFVPTMRIDSLVNEAHMSRTLDSLSEVTGQSVYEVADLKKAIIQLFRQAKEAGVVTATISFEPGTDFEEGSRDAADRILSLVLLGQKVNRDDRKSIRSYVIDQALAACAEHGMPLQVMLGARRIQSIGRRLAGYETSTVPAFVDLFARHSGVRFDCIIASETLAHEMAAVSRYMRNVCLSGYWWFLMFPEHIRKIIRERVQMLPMTESCGFFSDAPCVEWVYGKLKIVRRELAFALTEMVQEGYLSTGTAVEVARHYLYENPRRIYKLGE